ncbi:conserved Plasmodium protein, unknown function [Plasmodium ovale wallikeri]|uniref:Uncharacterized protein n=2 Tax=Plasmodium ovale TaxID=36330 RepID=A0A1A8YJR4_PLAOA|nr:conserved Plasmodium protein, unknown function [Plasmodium ovale wallikeri]SBT31784.1 conserved Plasmodium protein, unknown function [Plasmodium ovale wallikeri]SBT75486.1 conserved Plasmodium protein, unknown function [Plasmodium ovale]
MGNVKISIMFFLVTLNLIMFGMTKCEKNDLGTASAEVIKPIHDNIMNVLNSVSVGQGIKREKNILTDLSNYTQFLKVLSSIEPQNMEYEGLLNIDTTKKKGRNRKNFNIIYSSRRNYKNNINDVKKGINRALFV